MTLINLRDRLARIEQARADRTTAEAIILTLDRGEDAEPLIAARLQETGQQRGRTPVIVIRPSA